MTIRIGANPIGWSNDDMLEIGANISLEQCLTEARAAGFGGMELGHKFPRQAGALREVLSHYGMDLVGGWYSCELLRRDADAEIATMRPHLDLLKALGSPVFIIAETSNAIHGDRSAPLSRRPVLRDQEWPEFGRRMTLVADRVKIEGLQLVYHHHMGTIVQSEADIDAFMIHTGPAVHLLLDTGHATWGGADPAELARRYRGRISHVHTKDVRRGVREKSTEGDWSFLNSVLSGVYTVPGDGEVDFVAVFRELPAYSGWVVVEAEQDPAIANPANYARMGYDNLVRFLGEAGLR